MFVKLTMVIPERDRPYVYEGENVPEEGEDDGIVQLHPQTAEPTKPTVINAAHVRNIYARKKRRDGTTPVGTRITFVSGAGFAVTETLDEVATKLGVTQG